MDPAGLDKTPDGIDLGPTDSTSTCCLFDSSGVSAGKKIDVDHVVTGYHKLEFWPKYYGTKDGKCCRAECCLYRQHVKGFWQLALGGPKHYRLGSGGSSIDIENWAEEETGVILTRNPRSVEVEDFPTSPATLRAGMYFRMYLEFKYRIWDVCQAQWVSGFNYTGTLDIGGRFRPRFQSYTTSSASGNE